MYPLPTNFRETDMTYLHKAAAAVAAAALTIIAPAAAFSPGVEFGGSQFTLGISGFVPVVCRARLETGIIAPQAGTVNLGTLSEFCNSPNGYRVHADYSAELAAGKLIVDGSALPLQSEGSSVVTQSDRAAIDSHDLQLELPEGIQTGQISFRIEPL